jgi:two-component system, OmpR family, osmolarity sensor histidine kinase EnvZ
VATTIDENTPEATAPPSGVRAVWQRVARTVGGAMPKGLFARSLLIIITPVVLLQALVAFVFMERNWAAVTTRLMQATVGDIAAIVDIIEEYPHADGFGTIVGIASNRFGLNAAVLPPEPLPPPGPKPFFSTLDRILSQEITRQIGKPFWIDTVGRSNILEIRIQLADNVLRVFAPRSQTYASNSLVFISWMVATSAILLAIAIVFLRNQIRPILRLTAAVDDFGKGRAVADFPPRGAREVRQATIAFHQMRQRVERQIEQRTAMLAGVSHDLRTILTRLRLQLAFIEDSADVDALKSDIDDMNRMLEGYLAFARGDSDEETASTDIAALLDELAEAGRVSGHVAEASFSGDPIVRVRPQSFKRCIANLVGNAGRHGETVAISGVHADGLLTITIDDDGPGVPFEEKEAVFKPFYRLDDARNLDETGTGLGLPIARDIARSHGGEITLTDSPMGGLRVTVTVPA